MADDKMLITDPHGVEVSVPADAPMPPVEPGHKGHELNPGDVFDPNAARRFAEGRGPGLQDSEIMQPAHWVQEPAVVLTPEAIADQIDALEREKAGYEQAGNSERASQAGKEISRLKGELKKADKADDSTQAQG